MPDTNGRMNLKTIGGISAVMSLAGLIFVAGMQYTKVNQHVDNHEFHPTYEERRKLIGQVVEERLIARLGTIEQQLRTLTRELERLREEKERR